MKMADFDNRMREAWVAVKLLVRWAFELLVAHTSLGDHLEARDTERHLFHIDGADVVGEVAVLVAKDLSRVDHCTFDGAEKALVMAWTLEKVSLASVGSMDDTAHS